MTAHDISRFAAIFFALSTVAAQAQEFPLTIETTFGPVVIEAAPERVASIDPNGADNLLALGIQPVAIRYWYGDYPQAVWPWAAPLLTSTPEILRGDLNFEQIAATDPDVIIALWSGISQAEYDKLSLIAPTVAVPPGIGAYALPWDQQAVIAGRALGREDEALRQVEAIRDQLAAVTAAHPDWQGKTAAVAFALDAANPGAYTSADIRPQILAQMGFVTPPAVEALAQDASDFAVQISPEDMSPIDGDLIVWVTTDDAYPYVLDLPARPFMAAVQEGREIFTDTLVGGAFSHGSLLSLPYAIDHLEPMIAAALDGDPATHADQRPQN